MNIKIKTSELPSAINIVLKQPAEADQLAFLSSLCTPKGMLRIATDEVKEALIDNDCFLLSDDTLFYNNRFSKIRFRDMDALILSGLAYCLDSKVGYIKSSYEQSLQIARANAKLDKSHIRYNLALFAYSNIEKDIMLTEAMYTCEDLLNIKDKKNAKTKKIAETAQVPATQP